MSDWKSFVALVIGVALAAANSVAITEEMENLIMS